MPVLTPALTVYIAYLFLTVPLKTVLELEILLEHCTIVQQAERFMLRESNKQSDKSRQAPTMLKHQPVFRHQCGSLES